jgi:peptide/nickel transport system permease protein
MQASVLLIDFLLYALILCGVAYGVYVWRTPPLRASWTLALKRPVSVASAMVLMFFVSVALLDSIHFRLPLPQEGSERVLYSEPQSVLDVLLRPLKLARERSYSRPLSAYGFKKESTQINGVMVRAYPRLKFGGAHLKDPAQEIVSDCITMSLRAVGESVALNVLLWALVLGYAKLSRPTLTWRAHAHRLIGSDSDWPLKTAAITLLVLSTGVIWLITLSTHYHVMGTDQTGNSVLLLALKSIRTAMVIGTLTTLVITPLALVLGITAGFFKGWVDELIQYVYTLLASVPDVLLIAASVLMLQVFIDSHTDFFSSSLARSDARLFFLCLILALTSFTGLCRLIRGETLKLRELEYIQAAQAFGASKTRILSAHIAPNLMHLVIIHCVTQFSGFILSEAVLSYVGVGVDANTASFGVMINQSRAELSQTPVIWWTLVSAFVFMFGLVISANLLADAVRDAFDPKSRHLSFKRHATPSPKGLAKG